MIHFLQVFDPLTILFYLIIIKLNPKVRKYIRGINFEEPLYNRNINHGIEKKISELVDFTPKEFEEYSTILLSLIGYNEILLTPLVADSAFDLSAKDKKTREKVLLECKKYSIYNKVTLEKANIKIVEIL